VGVLAGWPPLRGAAAAEGVVDRLD
jgi:hypothetical protein